MMCNGANLDDIRFHIHGQIERVGWAVVPVQGDRPSRSWAYTIGLSTSFDHPELGVVGLGPRDAGKLLNLVGEEIRAGVRFASDEVILLPRRAHIHLVEVHPSHFTGGTFAMLVDYYGALGPPHPKLDALELVLPGSMPRLDRSPPMR